MKRLSYLTVLGFAVACVGLTARAFSLLGPYAADVTGTVWQTPEIAYQMPGDIGGPMNLGEEYRWSIKTITYGFDQSFVDYFGARGTQAVMEAIAILNALPPFSQMSQDLSEFPLEATRVNYRASALYLIDLKSQTLAMLLEEMGLACPERYCWTLRSRVTPPGQTNYTVIMRNFDPVTWAPSRYVNGTLFTYFIYEDLADAYPFTADAVELLVDPLAYPYTTVISAAHGYWGDSLGYGEFFTGLTRDDVGGLRYLYRPQNFNVESLLVLTNITWAGGPWTPWYGTNVIGTNLLVDVALRPGVDKIVFKHVPYNSIFGNFIVTTQQYTDSYVTNNTLKTQNIQRGITVPDIVFAAADIGLTEAGTPWLLERTATAAWVNNDALNGSTVLAGPGQIVPPIYITFNKIGPWYFHSWPWFLDEANPALIGLVWGSFDGSTNPPVVYPIGTSIQQLERFVLGGY